MFTEMHIQFFFICAGIVVLIMIASIFSNTFKRKVAKSGNTQKAKGKLVGLVIAGALVLSVVTGVLQSLFEIAKSFLT